MDALSLGLVGDGALRAAVAADREVTRMEGVRLDHLAQYLGEVSAEWEAPTPGPGVEQAVRLGGPGTPVVPEFAVCEIATALGLTQPAATGLCADVLDLAYRLRRVAGSVRCGQLTFARARVIARRTRDLPAEQAKLVEERLCTVRHTGAGPVPMAAVVAMSRLKSVTDQAVLTVRGPESAAEAEQRVAESLWVRVSPAEPGAADVTGRLAAADAVRLEQRLDQIAGWLQQVGDDRPKPILRAVALGLLADPDLLQALADLREEKQAGEGGQDAGKGAGKGARFTSHPAIREPAGPGPAGQAGTVPAPADAERAERPGQSASPRSGASSDSERDPVSAPGVPVEDVAGLPQSLASGEPAGLPQLSGPDEQVAPDDLTGTQQSADPQHSTGPSPCSTLGTGHPPGTSPPAPTGSDGSPPSGVIRDADPGADPPPCVQPAIDRADAPPWVEPDADHADPPPLEQSEGDREDLPAWSAPADDPDDAEPAVPDPVRPPGEPEDQPTLTGTAVPTCAGETGRCWCASEPSSDGRARPHAIHLAHPAAGSDQDEPHTHTDVSGSGLLEPPQLRRAGIAGCPAGVLEKFATISSTVLYLHLDRASGTWTEERGGVLTSQQARALVGHSKVSVRPVLDLAEPLSYTGYVAPPLLKEQLALLNAGYCPFPYCHRRARAGDVDHQRPAAAGGATASGNTHRPCRKHHRAKDKGGWKVVCPVVGVWVWTSPAGAVYLVTNGTTTQLNGITRYASDLDDARHSPSQNSVTQHTPRQPRSDVPTTVKEAWTPPWDPWDDPDPLTHDEHDVTHGLLNA